MKESKAQTILNKWMKHKWEKGMCVVELKITNSDSLPFSAVREHQLIALRIAKAKGFPYKIPDVGIQQKPFDMAFFNCPAYVVVAFYTPRQPLDFFFFDIDLWDEIEKTSDRKSITKKMALTNHSFHFRISSSGSPSSS